MNITTVINNIFLFLKHTSIWKKKKFKISTKVIFLSTTHARYHISTFCYTESFWTKKDRLGLWITQILSWIWWSRLLLPLLMMFFMYSWNLHIFGKKKFKILTKVMFLSITRARTIFQHLAPLGHLVDPFDPGTLHARRRWELGQPWS